jgi:hypothetical protein
MAESPARNTGDSPQFRQHGLLLAAKRSPGGVRDEGLRGAQDGQRVRALRAACDLHRASLGRGLERASCDVDNVRGQATGGAWRASFLDGL